MSQLLHFGEIVAMNAYLSPDKVGARDLTRSLTFCGWNDLSCKLANAHNCLLKRLIVPQPGQ